VLVFGVVLYGCIEFLHGVRLPMLLQATDPFSRKPLTLGQLIPDKELADKIKAWRRGEQRAG
jgi:hypothetical protein